ncbi:hypothetical protein BJX96DRAFT_173162 [Aspergillus floccosus]
MPEFYTRYGANDTDRSYTFPEDWTPDAVAINLGTNDFSYLAFGATGQSYLDFVQRIHTHYSTAKFFLMASPMCNDSYAATEDAQHTTQSNSFRAASSSMVMPTWSTGRRKARKLVAIIILTPPRMPQKRRSLALQ